MISKFKHEIFITESTYRLLFARHKKSRSSIYTDVVNYCDYVSNHIGLKVGMSVMLIVRESLDKVKDVYFVYNQCLDTQTDVSPDVVFKHHNPSLNIDTHIFKGMKQDARNKYFKWGSKLKKSGSIEVNPRSFSWK